MLFTIKNQRNAMKIYYHSTFFLFFSLFWLKMVLKLTNAEDNVKILQQRDIDEDYFQFDVQLFLELQFVNELLASQIETFDENNPNVMHLRKAIQTQVSCHLRRSYMDQLYHCIMFLVHHYQFLIILNHFLPCIRRYLVQLYQEPQKHTTHPSLKVTMRN